MSYKFDAQFHKDRIVQWIRDYFEKSGSNAEAVIGISGGKDSTVVAALCVEAIGKDRVVGIQMPNRIQSDIEDSNEIIKTLGIKRYLMNIAAPIDAVYDAIALMDSGAQLNSIVKTNLPARMRMLVLYAYANQHGGRVACTSNLSETFVGYNTRWGDDVGDFAPLENLTATEVTEIGKLFPTIPKHLIVKVPHDGMCGQTDEDRFGFTYKDLDAYIRGDHSMNGETIKKIENWHAKSQYKRDGIYTYQV